MDLSHKQKKRLRRYLREMPFPAVAEKMGVSEPELADYVNKHWKDEKFNTSSVTSKPTSYTLVQEQPPLRRFIKENWYHFLTLTVLVIIAYSTGFFNQFLSDDMGAIVDNRELNDWGFLSKNFFTFIRVSLYIFITKTFGLNPFIFRLINIFSHLGSVFFIYLIISYMTEKRLGFIAAALYAVHPILIESVTWISGGPYSQFSFFLFVSLFFYLFSRNKTGYIISLVALILAMFSSEKSVMFPGILIAAAISFSSIQKEWKKLFPFAALGVLWVAINLSRIGGRVEILETSNYMKPTVYNPFTHIPVAVATYLKLIFWPIELSFYHSDLQFTKVAFTIMVLITLAYLALTAYFFFKNKLLFFWMSFFIIALSPTMTPFGISWVVAERYAYFGAIGVIFVIAYLINKIIKNKSYDTFGWILFVIILCGFTVRTITRNRDWRTMDDLSIATARYSMSDPKTHNNLGDVYAKRGDLPKAIESFQTAIKLNPGYADAYHNLANMYQQSNQFDLAIENYEKALSINPNIWQTYQELGVVYYRMQQSEKAFEYMQKAAAMAPLESNVQNNLGVMYLQAGDKEKAKAAFTQALKLDPQNQKAQLGLQEASK